MPSIRWASNGHQTLVRRAKYGVDLTSFVNQLLTTLFNMLRMTNKW